MNRARAKRTIYPARMQVIWLNGIGVIFFFRVSLYIMVVSYHKSWVHMNAQKGHCRIRASITCRCNNTPTLSFPFGHSMRRAVRRPHQQGPRCVRQSRNTHSGFPHPRNPREKVRPRIILPLTVYIERVSITHRERKVQASLSSINYSNTTYATVGLPRGETSTTSTSDIVGAHSTTFYPSSSSTSDMAITLITEHFRPSIMLVRLIAMYTETVGNLVIRSPPPPGPPSQCHVGHSLCKARSFSL